LHVSTGSVTRELDALVVEVVDKAEVEVVERGAEVVEVVPFATWDPGCFDVASNIPTAAAARTITAATANHQIFLRRNRCSGGGG